MQSVAYISIVKIIRKWYSSN